MDPICESPISQNNVALHDLTLAPRTELLLEKGYDVHGIIRRSSSFNTSRLQHLYEDQHERKKSFLQSRPSHADAPM